MKWINVLLCGVILIGGVFAGDIMSLEEEKSLMTLIDSTEFASLNEYNDYTVPKKDGEVNLLDYLSYSPGIRDQSNCGNCWVWSGFLATELALSIEAGVEDRLSVQHFDSNIREEGLEPCEGGFWKIFDQAIDIFGKFVPWTDYTDKDHFHENRTDLPSLAISEDVYYPVSIDYKRIKVEGVEHQVVEDTLKEYLDHGKVIGFMYHLPEANDWDQFKDFWLNETEDEILDFDSLIDNITFSDGGGHAVNIVGYNEIERYWIVSNSWGDANGARPNGYFKMSMDIDYDAKRDWYGRLIYRYAFVIYDYEFGNEKGLRIEPEVDSKVNIDKVVFDKVEVNAGDVITTSTKVSNDYEYMNLQNVRVSYYIPKLGMKRSVGPFDIEMFEDVMKRVYLDIPKSAEKGVYDVRIVLQTEDTKEVRYEEIIVE